MNETRVENLTPEKPPVSEPGGCMGQRPFQAKQFKDDLRTTLTYNKNTPFLH